MTGPEHYREAEKFLALAGQLIRGEKGEAEILAEAQMHATLALAAATAMSRVQDMPVWDADEWEMTAGTQPRASQDSAS
jgi:hypothetical protein